MSEENTPVETQEEEQEQRFEKPFDFIAYILMTMRLSLENGRDEGDVPRYARIARANEHLTSTSWTAAPAKWTKTGVEYMNIGMAKLIDYTLYSKQLLLTADSTIALAEVAIDMLGVVTNKNFWEAMGNAWTPLEDDDQDTANIVPTDTLSPELSSAWVSKVYTALKYFPGPEDLDRIAHELYRLACLVYQKTSEADSSYQLNLLDVGKLRLLQYTFNLDWNTYYDLPAGNESKEVGKTTDLGKGYLPTAPVKHSVTYKGHTPHVPLFEYVTPLSAKMKNEAGVLLFNLGYLDQVGTPTKAIIEDFQYVNGLATTGVLDPATVNRLFNIDLANKTIKRAKPKPAVVNKLPIGYLPLINGDADAYSSEGIEVKEHEAGKYKYYLLGKGPEDKMAWKLDLSGNYINGFIALQSRYLNINRKKEEPLYEGGKLSEGEASNGKFFFAARHTQPWIAGRNGTPEPNEYNDGSDAIKGGRISRMYQDVEIDLSAVTSGITATRLNELVLSFEAQCLRRSLYTDRARSGALKGQPDQGRILLEIYETVGEETKLFLSDVNAEKGGGWLPGKIITSAFLSDAKINQRNNWFKQTSGLRSINGDQLKVESDWKKLTARVILEGKHSSGWDTDAYFDEVRIKYEFTDPAVAK